MGTAADPACEAKTSDQNGYVPTREGDKTMRTASLTTRPATPTPNFHGAAITAADGREIPISEEMVRASLAKLHVEWCKRKAQQKDSA